MRYYAGIGSRETPSTILTLMRTYAQTLAGMDFTLRSGGARGADTAFEAGAKAAQGSVVSIHPDGNWTRIARLKEQALGLAKQFHPAWDRCSDFARMAHARNGLIVLGMDLVSPVEFILCWTPRGAITGGTGQALRIAKAYSIPVCNLETHTLELPSLTISTRQQSCAS